MLQGFILICSFLKVIVSIVGAYTGICMINVSHINKKKVIVNIVMFSMSKHFCKEFSVSALCNRDLAVHVHYLSQDSLQDRK